MPSNSNNGAARPSLVERLGIHPPLAWGFLGLLLFMIGDGVESGYLSPFLISRGISQPQVALIFTIYGVTAAIAAWLSGALSDLWGPRQVMWIGLVIWTVFEIVFLLVGVAQGNYSLVMLTYALRGFGYPLFAYGFLVWITAATPPKRMGTAVGWFWFAFTGGLPTLGSLFASYFVPLIGPYLTLWCSLGLVVLGGLVALLGIQEPTGKRRLAPPEDKPLKTVISSIMIAWKKPRIAIGCIVRVINTAP
jgi:MFS family permease